MQIIGANSSSNSWPKEAGEYKVGDAIGAGATAIVYGAFCKPKSQKCAIKIISIKDSSTKESAFSEIRFMSKLSQENIVNFHTSFIINNEMWLVIDLLRRGSLFRIKNWKMKTRDCSHGVFDEETIATVLKQVLKGLEYLHSLGVVHRDIKTQNILMDEDGTVKIGDFGLAGKLKVEGLHFQPNSLCRVVGTPCWMAPEVINGINGYDFKADIWSFGITVFEMVTGCAPYQHSRKNNVFDLILRNDPPTIDNNFVGHNDYEKYGKSIRTMMKCCLRKNPAERYMATEVLNHEFFKMANNRNYLTNVGVDR